MSMKIAMELLKQIDTNCRNSLQKKKQHNLQTDI